MNSENCDAVGRPGRLAMFDSILFFVNRYARVAVAITIVAATVSAATVIGWMTAPV